MALFLKIVDAQGNPDPGATLESLLVENLLARGVGVFRTSAHVGEDLRQVVRDVLRAGEVVVVPQHVVTCSSCAKAVTVWHTYADGSTICGYCRK